MESTNNEIEYEVILKFSSLSSAGFFLCELEQWKEWKENKRLKKLNDQRGKHTAGFHQQARLHKFNNPDLTYQDCLKYVRSNIV